MSQEDTKIKGQHHTYIKCINQLKQIVTELDLNYSKQLKSPLIIILLDMYEKDQYFYETSNENIDGSTTLINRFYEDIVTLIILYKF